jgi:hypothetical protein
VPLELRVYVSSPLLLKDCCFSTSRTTSGCFSTYRTARGCLDTSDIKKDVSVPLEQQMDVSPHNATYH